MEKVLPPAVVAAIVAGIWSLVTMLLNRHWAKKDKRADKLTEISDSIERLDEKLAAHIAADDERYATQCRARIISFGAELMNEPEHRHTKGQFDAVLGDITSYTQYCDGHPSYRNEMTNRSVEIIRSVYDECAREHKFL